MATIEAKDLTIGYDRHPVASNISFDINKGDYVCIVGENGSGKSTLMKTILGLCKPMSGKITFGDGLKQKEIGYLPQQTIIQRDFPASVEEIIKSGCLNSMGMRPFYTKKEQAKVENAIKRMEIEDLRKKSYSELSGGQQQRVLLARAICATGSVLILDEPVAGLDPEAMEMLYGLIYRINKEDVITVIMVSHDVNATLSYASHIIHIGETETFFGTKYDFLKTDEGRMFASRK